MFGGRVSSLGPQETVLPVRAFTTLLLLELWKIVDAYNPRKQLKKAIPLKANGVPLSFQTFKSPTIDTTMPI